MTVPEMPEEEAPGLAGLEGVEVAEGVDLDAEQALLAEGAAKRICVSTLAHAPRRCSTYAVQDSLLCAAHSGMLDASRGGKAASLKRRKAREAAEDRVMQRSLGIRAAAAAALAEKTEQVQEAIRLLADDAANEHAPHAQRLKSAAALLPWVDQALGKPTERVEHTLPQSLEELEAMPTVQLEAVVAEGRRRRLQAVPALPAEAMAGHPPAS
jgi:hypothetical protein